MKRLSELFVVVCFLGFLTAAMAGTLLREEETYSFFENRRLAAKPEYSAQSDGDGSYAAQWERWLADHAAGRRTLLKAKTRLDLALGRPVVNDVVVTEENLLPYAKAGVVNPDIIADKAQAMGDNLSRIRDTVEDYGGYYCYVGVPCQYAYHEDSYPWYLNDRSELTRLSVEELSKALEQRQVDFLDMGAVFDQMGRPEELSSPVDNHYSIRGAYVVYQTLMEQVAARTGLDIPILEEEDVTFTELPNDYLGSRERKLLGLERREDKLSLLEPVEPIPFTRMDNGKERPATVYSMPKNEWEPVLYGLYMGGDIAETVVDTGREELPSVLIYGDSFTNALECVLYLSFDKMYSLDLRHYKDMSLEEYIQAVQPDVVVCVRDYEALLDQGKNGGAP